MVERLKRLAATLYVRVTRRLVNKLILLFAAVIIVVVASLTYISYKIMERESVEQIVSSSSSNLRLVNKSLDNYFAEIELFSQPHLRFDAIINAVLHEPVDYTSRLYLEDYLRSLYYARQDIAGIYLYLIDEDRYYYILRKDQYVNVRSSEETSIPEQAWYQAAIAAPDNKLMQSMVFGGETGYPERMEESFMAYHRTYRTLADRVPRAVISFFFNPASRDEIIGDIPVVPGEQVLFTDEEQNPYYVSDVTFYERALEEGLFEALAAASEGTFSWNDGTQRYLVVYDRHQEGGRLLLKPIPYEEIYKAAHTTRNISIALGLLFLSCSLVLIVWTSNAITRPLKLLSRQMSRFSTGSFDVEAEVRGTDEIAYLSKHFNSMVRRTNELINERYRMQLVEKSAILKALEAEINPHFLYNALQAISTKALKNGRYDIADMVDALALTFRYCISGKELVKVSEEIRHIENYMMLQKARFGERLNMEMMLSEAALEVYIPKLSIQTLVENAIKHALEQVSYPIIIRIRAEMQNGRTVIAVSDNGPGIRQERLQEIMSSFETEWVERESKSIGLRNLNERLALTLGETAGLELSSDTEGTEIRIIIPGGKDHVQRTVD